MTMPPGLRLLPFQFLNEDGKAVYRLEPGGKPIKLTLDVPPSARGIQGTLIAVRLAAANTPHALVEFRNLKHEGTRDLLGQEGEWVQEQAIGVSTENLYELKDKEPFYGTERMTIECRARGEGRSALVNLSIIVEFGPRTPVSSQTG